MDRVIRCIASLMMAAAAPLANSAQSDNAAADWYQVEVIVFSQQDFYQSEIPRRDITLVYPDNWVILEDPSDRPEASESVDEEPPSATNTLTQLSAAMHNQAEPEAVSAPPELPYQLLAQDQLNLNPDAYTLTRAPGYRVLFHRGWRQPAENRQSAPWVLIKGGKQASDHFELEGSLRVYQSRYLHLQANLWKVRYQLQQPEASQPGRGASDDAIEQPAEKPWPQVPDAPLPPEPPQPPEPEIIHVDQLLMDVEPRIPFAYAEKIRREEEAPDYEPAEVVTLKQSHRLNLDQLHYLDHPNMGVLVKVSKYQPDQPEPQEDY